MTNIDTLCCFVRLGTTRLGSDAHYYYFCSASLLRWLMITSARLRFTFSSRLAQDCCSFVSRQHIFFSFHFIVQHRFIFLVVKHWRSVFISSRAPYFLFRWNESLVLTYSSIHFLWMMMMILYLCIYSLSSEAFIQLCVQHIQLIAHHLFHINGAHCLLEIQLDSTLHDRWIKPKQISPLAALSQFGFQWFCMMWLCDDLSIFSYEKKMHQRTLSRARTPHRMN